MPDQSTDCDLPDMALGNCPPNRVNSNPERVLQLHGVVVPKDKAAAEQRVRIGQAPGITTDPRRAPNEKWQLESVDRATDVALARRLAEFAQDQGVRLSGNRLNTNPTFTFNPLPSEEASVGPSFSVANAEAPAANVILVETHGNESTTQEADPLRLTGPAAEARARELEALATTIRLRFIR